jgi:hypothetical protein
LGEIGTVVTYYMGVLVHPRCDTDGGHRTSNSQFVFTTAHRHPKIRRSPCADASSLRLSVPRVRGPVPADTRQSASGVVFVSHPFRPALFNSDTSYFFRRSSPEHADSSPLRWENNVPGEELNHSRCHGLPPKAEVQGSECGSETLLNGGVYGHVPELV